MMESAIKEGVTKLADLPQEARMALQASVPARLHRLVRLMCSQVVLEKVKVIEERYMGPKIIKGFLSDPRRKALLDGTSVGAIVLHQSYHAS